MGNLQSTRRGLEEAREGESDVDSNMAARRVVAEAQEESGKGLVSGSYKEIDINRTGGRPVAEVHEGSRESSAPRLRESVSLDTESE